MPFGSYTWFQVGVPDPEGKGGFWVDETPSQNMQLLPTYENDILFLIRPTVVGSTAWCVVNGVR